MKDRPHKKNNSPDKLTVRESAFLKNIEAGMTITSAARSAGYSQKWPGQAGSQSFRNIQRKRPEILDHLGLTVDAILTGRSTAHSATGKWQRRLQLFELAEIPGQKSADVSLKRASVWIRSTRLTCAVDTKAVDALSAL